MSRPWRCWFFGCDPVIVERRLYPGTTKGPFVVSRECSRCGRRFPY